MRGGSTSVKEKVGLSAGGLYARARGGGGNRRKNKVVDQAPFSNPGCSLLSE